MAAVVIAVGVMLFASGPVSNFVNGHPTVKMLALSFLLLVGVALVADGLHFHIPKGYLYFAIAFSVLVEVAEPAGEPAAQEEGGRARRLQAAGDRLSRAGTQPIDCWRASRSLRPG